MSYQAMTATLQLALPAAQKMVMQILANYADENNKCFPGRERIAHESGVSLATVKRYLKQFEADGLITTHSRPRRNGTNDTNVYQLTFAFKIPAKFKLKPFISKHAYHGETPENQGGQPDPLRGHSDHLRGSMSNAEGVTVTPEPISEPINEPITKIYSSEEENISHAEEVIQHLNETTGSEYRTGKKTSGLIQARVADKFSIQDLKTIIVFKSSEWLNDPKMRKYLRPETLFGSKAESYLNAALLHLKHGENDHVTASHQDQRPTNAAQRRAERIRQRDQERPTYGSEGDCQRFPRSEAANGLLIEQTSDSRAV